MTGEVFVDWISASQRYPGGCGPILVGGLTVHYDREGIARYERASSASVGGSWSTSVRVRCDGSCVSISGNVGRFSRQDNLFNAGWAGTVAACNRILDGAGLPSFGPARGIPGDSDHRPAARVGRLDLTCNFATGSRAQSEALIRWLSLRSVYRSKRGAVGNESVWWSNTRHMLKAYIKGNEMRAHGADKDNEVAQYCDDLGIVRVEVELKRRLLKEIGLQSFEDITDEKLRAVFEDQTSIFRRVDRTDEPDILASIPARYRMTAAAWLAGQDVSHMVHRATLYRHAKVLRDYGIDILQARNVEVFPVKVRVIDLQPLSMPDWYRDKYFKVA